MVASWSKSVCTSSPCLHPLNRLKITIIASTVQKTAGLNSLVRRRIGLESNIHMIRLAVGAAGLAATLHTCFVAVTLWKILCQHWGDADIWINAPWELGIAPFTNALSKALFM